MARPPKLPALKALQGDTRQRGRKKAAAALKPPEEQPPEVFFSDPWAPPAWLADAAKQIWNDRLPIVRQQTKIQQVGLDVFANYCDAVYRLQKYSQDIEKEGATYRTASGYFRKRPEVELRDRAARDVKDLASELNLTPKSWIGSMGTYAGRQLDLFMNGGRGANPPPPAPTASPVSPPQPGAALDDLSDFLGARPTIN